MSDAAYFFEKTGRQTLIFIDEIHRFNKAQQDAFLPFVEKGQVLLIGTYTVNPSFDLNAALMSRVKVLTLRPLDPDDIEPILAEAGHVRPRTPRGWTCGSRRSCCTRSRCSPPATPAAA